MEEERHKKETPSEIEFLKAIIERLKNHLAKNKHDYKTKRTLLIKEAKLHKLERYKGREKK